MWMDADLCEKCASLRGADLSFKTDSLSTIIKFWPLDELFLSAV